VRLPSSASDAARLTDRLVLPTPPLPPVTAMLRTGVSGAGLASGAFAAGMVFSGRGSGDGMVVLRGIRLIGSAAQIFKVEDQAGRNGAVQVLGHPRAVGGQGQRELVVHRHRD